jgi:hypothetical protein
VDQYVSLFDVFADKFDGGVEEALDVFGRIVSDKYSEVVNFAIKLEFCLSED